MKMLMLAVSVAGLLAGPIAAHAQDGQSVAAAAKLAALLEAAHLRAFAAPDPEEPGRYVAAMHVPGSQLLVVSARYAVPVLMKTRLEERQYEQAYMDLQSASVFESKWFVQDLGADGLQPAREPDQPFDLVYRQGARYAMLDGDWTRQGLTAREYRLRFDVADQRYTKMLNVLVTALGPQT